MASEPLSHSRFNVKAWFDHPGFKRYFKNTTWLFSGRLVNMAISFFVASYVIRSLGPDTYGLLSYAISFAGLSAVIANLGLDQIISRELVAQPEKRGVLLGTAMTIKLCGAMAAILFTILLTILIGNNLYTSLLIILITTSYLFAPLNIFNVDFQARAIGSYPTLITLSSVFILSILKIVGVFFGLPLIYFGLIYFLEPVLYGIGYIFVFKIIERGNFYSLDWNSTLAKHILSDSWPLIISTVFVTLYYRIDQIILKIMIDERAVGIYDAGVRLAELWYFIPGIITVSFFPALLNAKKIDIHLYERRLGRLYFLLAWLGIGITFFIFACAPLIVSLLYGAEYSGTVTVLRMYVLATVAVFVTSPLNQHLINNNKTGIIFASSCITLVTNVILNFLLIPLYGINGSALATFISYSLIPLSILFFKETRSHLFFMLRSFFSLKLS